MCGDRSVPLVTMVFLTNIIFIFIEIDLEDQLNQVMAQIKAFDSAVMLVNHLWKLDHLRNVNLHKHNNFFMKFHNDRTSIDTLDRTEYNLSTFYMSVE